MNNGKTTPVQVRLLSRVERSGDCWEWTGGLNNYGYGSIWVGPGLGRDATHRVAYRLWVGPIPVGLEVMHRCDNPVCLRPAHLLLGTHADNMADMRLKGRARGKVSYGADHPAAKLTEADVATIRATYRTGDGNVLARRYGVNHSTIMRVVTGRTWAIAGLPVPSLFAVNEAGKIAHRAALARAEILALGGGSDAA